MKFDVYCDESRHDLLTSAEVDGPRFIVIGSLWLPRSDRREIKRAIYALREKHRIGSEFKWQKVSRSRLQFYVELIQFFLDQPSLRFRSIAVPPSEVDLVTFHESDAELGFYKFYYQLLHHWILDLNTYSVFCDFKTNRRRDRLEILRRCLGFANLTADVERVQATRSDESVLLQLADVLTGAVAARLNGQLASGSAREALLRELEDRLGRRIAATTRSEMKFNVFRIRLGGGW